MLIGTVTSVAILESLGQGTSTGKLETVSTGSDSIVHTRSAIVPFRFSGSSAFLVGVLTSLHLVSIYPKNRVDRISHHRGPCDNRKPLKYKVHQEVHARPRKLGERTYR